MRHKWPLFYLKNRRVCGWKFASLCPWGVILIFCLGLSAGIVLFHWQHEIPMSLFYSQNEQHKCHEKKDLFRFVSQLESLYHFLKDSSAKQFELQLLRQTIYLLDPEWEFAVKKPKYQPQERDVCGEVYTGAKDGPFFRTGFVPDPACNSIKLPAFTSLVTIILIVPGTEHSEESLTHSIAPLRNIYPNLEVVIAIDDRVQLKDTTEETQFIFCKADDFRTPGKLWNQLIKKTLTRYVLVARDVVRVDEMARLPRLVHVLSTRNGSHFAIAGGAVRYPSGRWRTGCLQTEMRHYALRMERGYYFSAHDCMICDHLEGPFLAKTDVLVSVPFDEHMPGSVVFEDWFLRLKQRGVAVAACPDSLFFVNPNIGSEVEQWVTVREEWRMLGKAWKLDSISRDKEMSFEFKCDETDLLCDLPALRRHGLLIPPCCIEEIVNALQDFDNFASTNSLDYEVYGGMALGAVKLRSFMPWEIEGDIILSASKQKGYNLTRFTTTPYTKYFSIKMSNISFNEWGFPLHSTNALPKEMNETRVEINGLWLRSYWNPGLAVRNLYGPGYLRHPLYNSVLRNSSLLRIYSTRNWGNCAQTQHFSCLNKQPVDGSNDFHTYHQRDKEQYDKRFK